MKIPGKNFFPIAKCIGITAAILLAAFPSAAQNGNGKGNGNAGGACTVNGKTFKNCPPGHQKQANREAARQSAAPQKTGVKVRFAGINPGNASKSPLAPVSVLGPGAAPASMRGASGFHRSGAQMQATTSPLAAGVTGPDYFGAGNYANSPLATYDATTGQVTGGIRKFVDRLPLLGPTGANNLGNYIPLAVPDQSLYPGSDYYQIGA